MSYRIDHARLAREGINILNVVPHDGGISIIFEYSWHDQDNNDKLHWSKSAIFLHHKGVDSNSISSRIAMAVTNARGELEGGRR